MKPTIFYILPLLNLMFIASCKDNHWSYEGETGPEHWAEIDSNDCDGKFQSPVDIVNAQPSDLEPLHIYYSDETKIQDVTNNGHSIQFNFDLGDYIVLNGEKYELKQFHFHEPAEHTVKGVRYPLSIHLVHLNKYGKYAVLEVMAEESATNSESFDFLEGYLPLYVEETKDIGESFNINTVLPEKKQYYTYTGSLTTPPCTEDVQWFIFKAPVGVSLKMTKMLHDIMPLNNYRNTQPINGRVIKESL